MTVRDQLLEPLTAAPHGWTVSQGDLVRYAGTARDFNRIHYDAQAAQEFGFDRPIAHGMLNLGIILTRVADVVGVGSIRSSATRFSAPAHVGARMTLAFESTDAGVTATIDDDGWRRVLTSEIALGAGTGAGTAAVVLRGDVVADRTFVVERGPATRFAEALGARSGSFLRADRALEAGFGSIPVVPSYAFALPGWGFFPELDGNEGATPPDAVRDCQAWAGTTGPVVHAAQSFTHSRPMLVGETVRSQSVVVARTSKQRGTRMLRFTDVDSVLTDLEGHHILTSRMTLVVSN
jgi:acyl dehydratase